MAETPETVEVNVVMGAQLRAIVRSALTHVKNKLADTPVLESTKVAVKAIIDEELTKWPLSVAGEPDDTLPQWLFQRYGRDIERNPSARWDDLLESDKAYWEHEADAVRRATGRGGFKRTDPNAGSGFVLSTPINELHQLDRENTSGEVKGLRPLDLKNAESLGEAIRIAVGAASTCWTNMQGAGVFKSEEALDIATQLEHHYFELIMLGRKQMTERHQALGELLQKYKEAGVPMVAVQQVYNILCGQATPAEYESALQPYPHGHQGGPDAPEGFAQGLVP